MGQPDYNTRNIRRLLTEAFTAEKLREICADVPEFRPVLEEFATGMSKSDMIFRLIDHCKRHLVMDQLLLVVQEENPRQYALFANSLIDSDKKPELNRDPTSETVPDQVTFLQKLITTKMRLMNELQLQAAQYTILHLPVELKIQIENLEAEIADLQKKLSALR